MLLRAVALSRVIDLNVCGTVLVRHFGSEHENEYLVCVVVAVVNMDGDDGCRVGVTGKRVAGVGGDLGDRFVDQ